MSLSRRLSKFEILPTASQELIKRRDIKYIFSVWLPNYLSTPSSTTRLRYTRPLKNQLILVPSLVSLQAQLSRRSLPKLGGFFTSPLIHLPQNTPFRIHIICLQRSLPYKMPQVVDHIYVPQSTLLTVYFTYYQYMLQ